MSEFITRRHFQFSNIDWNFNLIQQYLSEADAVCWNPKIFGYFLQDEIGLEMGTFYTDVINKSAVW